MSALDETADDSDSSDGVPEIGLDALRPEALAALLSVKQARETAAARRKPPTTVTGGRRPPPRMCYIQPYDLSLM